MPVKEDQALRERKIMPKATRRESTFGDPALSKRIGPRSTPLRCSVLRVLEQAGRPLGAYEVMARLDVLFGRRHAPPTIYRTLEFLLMQRLAIRVVSLNAFMATYSTDIEDTMIFLCDRCGVAETVQCSDIEHFMDRTASTMGFHVTRPLIEIHGFCAKCVTIKEQNVSVIEETDR
jgi:Fur family transcriptional regulator, zinc uptake regulator